jgi:Protein of unknown function DUF104/Family of unknown function (DUF5678)
VKRQIHVVFENGVLRPLEPVDFAERQELFVTVNEKESVMKGDVTPAPYSTRRLEYQWLQEHGSEYLDQWVVVEGDQLVSHGPDGKAVYDAARAAGITTPFLTHVTPPDELPWGGW